MKKLETFLIEKGYKKIKLKKKTTNHFELKVAINGIWGRFILDTGASNSCVGIIDADRFKLKAEKSEIKAAGAGAIDIETQRATKNKLQTGSWEAKNVELVLFNLSHVNDALTSQDAESIHGILGADILNKGKAIIDYKKGVLYLK